MSVEATTLAPTATPHRTRRRGFDGRAVVPALRRKLLPFAGIALLLGTWHALAASGLYTAEQLPGPLDALRASREAWSEGSLLPHVGASLDVMERDARAMRGERPFLFSNLKAGQGVGEVAQFLVRAGGI